MTALQSDIDITGWWLEFSIAVRMLQFQPRRTLKTQKVALHAPNSRGFDKAGIGGATRGLYALFAEVQVGKGGHPMDITFLVAGIWCFLTTDY